MNWILTGIVGASMKSRAGGDLPALGSTKENQLGGGRLVHLPAPATFDLRQLGGKGRKKPAAEN